MTIIVEFFGIPRVRAGVGRVSVLSGCESASLTEVLSEVATRYPAFAAACMDGDRLRDGFVASIDGQLFVRDEEAMVDGDQSVLLLSADAGG